MVLRYDFKLKDGNAFKWLLIESILIEYQLDI